MCGIKARKFLFSAAERETLSTELLYMSKASKIFLGTVARAKPITASDLAAKNGFANTVTNDTPMAMTIMEGDMTPLEIPRPAITKLNSPIWALFIAAKYASRQRTPPNTIPAKHARV